MGYFENTWSDHPVSKELAKIVRALSADHRIESDLDLHVTALNNISNVERWAVDGEVAFDSPFIVAPTETIRIRVALFNELRPTVSSALSETVIKQYEDKIALFLKESHDMLNAKQIHGYFAAIVTENKASETISYYPQEGNFEYYYSAEPDGRSFRIIGETPKNNL